MRATSIRHEIGSGNFQSDYYGNNVHEIRQEFIKDFNRNLKVSWAKLFDELTGETILELSAG